MEYNRIYVENDIMGKQIDGRTIRFSKTGGLQEAINYAFSEHLTKVGGHYGKIRLTDSYLISKSLKMRMRHRPKRLSYNVNRSVSAGIKFIMGVR